MYPQVTGATGAAAGYERVVTGTGVTDRCGPQVTGPAGAAAGYDRAEAGGDVVLVRWPSGRQAAINTLVVQATVILLTHHPGAGEC